MGCCDSGAWGLDVWLVAVVFRLVGCVVGMCDGMVLYLLGNAMGRSTFLRSLLEMGRGSL